MKKCCKCKIDKEISNFRKDKSRKDALHPICSTCHSNIQREWYNKNKEKARLIARESYDKRQPLVRERIKKDRIQNPEKYRKIARKNYHKNPDARKPASWRRAGIKDMTIEKYNQMLSLQNNCCAICKQDQTKFKQKLSVDHCHTTGKIRGLLCGSCNRGLGYFHDSVAKINNAKEYLICHHNKK